MPAMALPAANTTAAAAAVATNLALICRDMTCIL
jgi:hypothetical protein